MMKFIKNNLGISLVESMIAIGVLAVAGVTVMNVTEQSQDAQQFSKKKTQVTGANFRFLESAKMVLAQTQKIGEPYRTEGLCKLVEVGDGNNGVASVLRPGVAPINIKLENIGDVLNDEDRIKRFLGEWREVGGAKGVPNDSSASLEKGQDTWSKLISEECSGIESNWKKCFVMDKSDGTMTQTIVDDMKIVASWETVPINMNPVKKINGKRIGLYEALNTPRVKLRLSGMDMEKQWVDVKDVGFQLRVKLSFYVPGSKGGEWNRNQKQFHEFFWTPGLGYCDKLGQIEVPQRDSNGNPSADENGNIQFVLEERYIKLSLGGTSAADEEGLVIINRNGFGGNLKKPIDVVWQKGIAQSGAIDENGLVSTVTEDNIAVSCNQEKFVCRDSSDPRDYEPLSFNANLTFNKPNNWTADPTMRAKFNLSIAKSSSTNEAAIVDSLTGTGSDTVVTIRQGNAAGALQGADQNIFTMSASHNFVFDVADENAGTDGVLRANDVCRQVCTAGNSFNDPNKDSSRDPSSFYAAQLQYTGVDLNNQEEKAPAVDTIVGCTACYMKNCKRYGIGTFGRMSEQPFNPQDVAVPECNIESSEGQAELAKGDSYAKNHNNNAFGAGAWDDTDKQCIRAYINTSVSLTDNDLTDLFIYEPANCGDENDILCFNQGKHMLARDINAASADAFTTTSYAQANHGAAFGRCIRMGRETISAQELTDLFAGSNGGAAPASLASLPTSGGNFSFMNLSQQGLFLGPQLNTDKTEFAKWLVYVNKNQAYNNPFWVGLKKDGRGHIRSAAPIIPDAADNYRHSVFYGTDRNIKHTQDGAGFPRATDNSGGGMMMTHSMKFKGARYVTKAAASGSTDEYASLCKNLATGKFTVSSGTAADYANAAANCSGGTSFLGPINPTQWTDAMLAIAENHDTLPFPNPNDAKTFVWVGWEKIDGATYSNVDVTGIIGDGSIYMPSKTKDNNRVFMNSNGQFANPRALLRSSTWSSDETVNGKDVSISYSGTGLSGGSINLDDRKYKIGDLASRIQDLSTSDLIVYIADRRIHVTTVNGGVDMNLQINAPKFSGSASFSLNDHSIICASSDSQSGYEVSSYGSSCNRQLEIFDVLGSEVFKHQWVSGLASQVNSNDVNNNPRYFVFESPSGLTQSSGLPSGKELDTAFELNKYVDSSYNLQDASFDANDVDVNKSNGSALISTGSGETCTSTELEDGGACSNQPAPSSGSGSGSSSGSGSGSGT